MTISEISKKITSYEIATLIPNYEKPKNTSFILGLSVRVVNETKALKGWDFGLSETFEYNPGKWAKMQNVM